MERTVGGLLAIVLSVQCAGLLHAQAFRASIIGRVTDPTDAAIPGARLKIIRVETNESAETYTDAKGSFSFAFLSPGRYSLTTTAIGFRTLEQSGITLDSNETRDVELTLVVGDVKDRVSVSADTERLETTTASRTERLNPKRLRDLPLIGRQAYSLVSLTPGVIFTQEQFGSNGFAGLRGWDANGKFIINGGREGTNQFLMNGAPVSVTGRWLFSPSIDAIQEFKVMINTYDPQFGRTGGGTVVTALKSGTNKWHGQLFEYFHNSLLDANTTQNNQVGAAKGHHSTNQFGATLGGPIKKDKDWIFLSYEGFREIVPDPIVLDTPPADLRAGLFARYNLRIYDPLSAHPCVVGVDTPRGVACLSAYVRSQFPRNQIPASRVSTIGQSILALFPKPNSAGLESNYIATTNNSRYHYDQGIAHWDHFFGERNRLSVVGAVEAGTDLAASGGFTLDGTIANVSALRLSQNYSFEWIHIRSASTVFDMRLSFGRFTEYQPDSGLESSRSASDLGILNIPKPPVAAQFDTPPAFNFDTFSTLNPNTFSWSSTNHWNIQPNAVHTRGRHVFHFGGEYAYATIGSTTSGKANGDLTFNRSWSQQWVNGRDGVSRNTGPLDGSAVADLLLGAPASGYVDYNDTFFRSWPYAGFYVQDTWKVRPKVTLSLGLRYDVQVPLKERFNRLNAGFDLTAKNPLSDQIIANWTSLKKSYDARHPLYPYPAAPTALYGGPQFAGTSGNSRRPYDTDWTDFQPRIGVAWSLLPHTVLRAGAGIFYRTADQLNQTIGFNRRTPYIASIDGVVPTAGLTGAYSLENPFPQGLNAPTGSSLGTATGVGDPIVFDGRQRPIPRTYQYSFGVQRELPSGVLLDVNYSGSQTVHDSMRAALGAPSAADFRKGTADPNYLDRQLPNPFLNLVPATSTLGNSIVLSAFDLLRSYPLFDGVTMTTSPWARYRYDALQVFVERKIKDLGQAGEFLFLLSYTYSKSLQQANRLNEWNLAERPVKELSPLDKPHTFALSGLWELPVGWGRKYGAGIGPAKGFFVNGWAMDWILTYNSGYPVAQPDAIFSCGSYAAVKQTAQHWFNNDPQCWQARPQYTLRTAPDVFSAIRNPAAAQLHASVEKTWWVNDRFTLQLRGESFNVTNTSILPGPNTDYRDPRFGQLPIQQNNFPRLVQVGLKLLF